MTDDFEEQLCGLTAEEQEILTLFLAENKTSDLSGAIPAQNDASMAFPLSYAQQRMWFLNQVDPQSAVYNMPAAYRLNGPLDIAALEMSLRALIERHSALRTVFILHNDVPQQLIREDTQFSLPVLDLSHLTPEERESAVREQLIAEGHEPFDLSRDLMLRATLLAVGTDEHILSIVMHHIASDGWSMAIFRRELAELYAAYSNGTAPKLAELPIQYTDYAVWQRDWLQGHRLEQQLNYWRKQLADVATIELPVDRRRPSVQSYQGDSFSFELPESLLRPLRALSHHGRSTLFMTLLAAFGTLLHRYSGQDDIVIGTVVANRRRTEVEGMIGFFLNTLALRIDLRGDPTFSEVLTRVRHVALDAFEHQDIPFEKLLAELQPERELNQMPVFQVLMVLQNTPSAETALAGVEIEQIRINHHLSKLDLSLYLTEVDNSLRAHIEYSTDLFDNGTIERMASHFQVLLENIVSDPDRPISKLTLMPAAERILVLDTWNQTDVSFKNLPDLVSQFYGQASANSGKTAFLDRAESLTYGELNRRSNQLAHYLHARGIRPETKIGVCLERSLDVPVALLAIFKVGGVYVPLDPSYPQERLRFMLEDAGVTAVITESKSLPKLALQEEDVADRLSFCLDDLHNALAQQSDEDVIPTLAPSDTAYIIYTSGSTGWPKGVTVPHRQILNRLAWMWQHYPFEAGEVGCQKTALSFVDSLWELFGYLLKGIPTVIIADEVVRDPQRLVDILAAHKVTRLWLVPSLLRVILDIHPNLQERLPNLRFWVSTGEALHTALYERFREVMPGSKLYNLYGTSEVWDATWFDPDEHPTSWHGLTVPIGRPISNMRAVVLGSNGQPVPIGVLGELYIGGDGLADGYINRPALTAERFTVPPWIDEKESEESDVPGGDSLWLPSDPLYRTGDTVRWLPEGQIEFMGRSDTQVKLRGHRVELAEIEIHLDRHPDVRQSAVNVYRSAMDTEQLLAYYVAQNGTAPDEKELAQFLRDHLPESMIPSRFLRLTSLPYTPSGKLDRRSLPAPDKDAAHLTNVYSAPRKPVEQELAAIWADVLERPRIGIHDDFFELGGHSLLGVRLFSRIEERFGRSLPLSLLFSAPTVARLSEYLEQTDVVRQSATLVPIQESGSHAPFFCVHGFGGGVLGYAELARLLGPDHPFYGLQAAGLEDDLPFDTTIEAMASRYVSAMRDIQPVGPYHVGGYCLGGVVAFEMARQLETAGEEIALVAIIEGYAPRRYQHHVTAFSVRRWQTVWQNIPYWLQDYWELGLDGMRLRFARKARIWRKRLLRLFGADAKINAQDILPDDLSVLPEHRRQLLETHLFALQSYEPAPIKGKLTLFAARGITISNALFGSGDPEHGWGALTESSVDVVLVEGGHRDVHLQPNVASLAAALEQELKTTEASTGH